MTHPNAVESRLATEWLRLSESLTRGDNFDDILQRVIAIGRKYTAATQITITLNDTTDDELHAGEHLLRLPILVADEQVGTLTLSGTADSAPFSADDSEIGACLAGFVGLAVAHTQQSALLNRRNRQLASLSEATIAISRELSLQKVVQQIVDSARELIGAQYAALGVPNSDGYLDTFIYSGMAPEDAERIPRQPQGLGLLGAITRSDHALRIDNIATDFRSSGFPENHPPMTNFLGAPIVAGERIIGRLYFTNKIGAPAFTQDDEDVVMMYAAHASVALQNAKLYEQVEQLAVLDERTRIGMDLHDGIIQSIYAMGLVLESAKLVLPEGATDAQRLLDMAVAGLNDSIKDIRNFIMDLRPRRFRGDLALGLAQLVREFQANTLIPVDLTINSAELTHLPTVVARAIYLTTQEALANIARHAKASQANVSIVCSNSRVILTIEDDGRGFDADDNSRRIGHGLANMEARAEELNGRFILRAAPGSGTTVIVRLPITIQTIDSL